MPKLHSSDWIIKTLEKHGFIQVSQKGSHLKMRSIGEPVRTVIIPTNRKEIPMGTFQSILRQSGLTNIDFN